MSAASAPKRVERDAEARPGRTCPVSYRYAPSVFDRAPEVEAATLYVVGGLYGNVEALAAVLALAAGEDGPVRIVFNGDFHWFDVAPGDFIAIDAAVREHVALRGNVETEIAGEASGAGCGCAYPADVSDAEVARSNAILERLRDTARGEPRLREGLGRLPMHLVARVGDARIGIVHGDATSLAGWGFAHDRLRAPSHRRWIDAAFDAARVDVFASSHTCLPALVRCDAGGAQRVVANNGAAGMPNAPGTRFGLLTRIGTRPERRHAATHGEVARGAHVQALRIEYDHARWLERFLAAWPPGSPAHEAYFRRIVDGPRRAPL